MKEINQLKQGRKAIDYAMGLFVIISVLGLGFNVLENSFIRFAPHTTWFEYIKTETVTFDEDTNKYVRTNRYPTGEKFIPLKSYSVWRKDHTGVNWTDSLYCQIKPSDDWSFIGSQSSSGSVPRNLTPEPMGVWRLNVQLPFKDSKCKVRSKITTKIRGFNKQQVLESNEFLVTKKPVTEDYNLKPSIRRRDLSERMEPPINSQPREPIH